MAQPLTRRTAAATLDDVTIVVTFLRALGSAADAEAREALRQGVR